MKPQCLLRFVCVLLFVQFIVFTAHAADEDAAKITSAKTLIRNRDYTGARLMLKDVAEQSPAYVETLLLRAQCDEGEGDINAAIVGYRKVMDLSADNESMSNSAKACIDRLDEGRKVLAHAADQLENEAKKYKDTNLLAFETIMAAVQQLRGEGVMQTTMNRIAARKGA